MKFSYNWLQDYLSKKITPQKMAELLTRRSFQVESVERRGDDFILDIDVLPNRSPDCFSHFGVAREVAAVSGLKLKIPRGASSKTVFRKGKRDKKENIEIEVREKWLCPRYSARILTGVKVGPSPKWLARRLEAIGQKPINNIVDIANFVMLELGQPLHAFDLDKLEGGKIIVRRAKKRERIVSLDGEKYELDERILVIADANNPVAIAGIKGGSGPGISSKTKTIVLESANFDSQSIRNASRILNLRTDASMRFEQGIDPNLTEIALNRACSLIQECAGGRAVGEILDFYPNKVLPKKIKLEMEKINKLAGFQFKPAQVVKILNSLGFKVKMAAQKSRELIVEAPTWRRDIEIPEDLIEEICRLYGYENIPARLPEAVLIPSQKDDFLKLFDKIKVEMAGQGFYEVYNYSFLSEREIKILEESAEKFIELANPISQDYRYLRNSLIIGLLKNIAHNSKHFKEVKIFEIGKVFWPIFYQKKVFDSRKQKSRLWEQWRFSGAIWRKNPEKIAGELFYELKGVVDGLLDSLGIGERWYDNVVPTAEAPPQNVWNLARSAEIKFDSGEFGFIGEIRPLVLDKFDIPSVVVAFDFDLENLLKFVQEEREYTPIPKYPAVVRDIAILVDKETRISEVMNVIYSAGVKYLEDVDLFDVYEGAGLGQGRKSLAFHLIFQAQDHTLTDSEVNGEVEKILKVLREELNAEIRK